jgi:hypothetical protein
MSSSGSSGGAFNFDTPQAVMHVLASVRKSDISANDKNSLRDLILSYTNGGKDPSLKIQIEQKLASLAVQPLPQNTSSASVAALGLEFGSSRNVPALFTASAPVAKPIPVPVVPAQQPTSVVTPVIPVVQPAPAIVQPVSTPVASAPAPQPTTVEPTPQPVEPVLAPIPQPVAVPVPNADNSAALARVREIKSIVNDKIGNPVNLVDIDNKVGREYMSALLEAMKKLSSGVNSASTMQRLEAAFVEVEHVLEQPRPPVEPTISRIPVPVSEPTPVTAKSLTPEPPTAPAPAQPQAAPTPVPVAPVPPVPRQEPVVPIVDPLPKPAIAPVIVEPEPEPAPKPKPVPVEVPKPTEQSTEQNVYPASTSIEDKRWNAAAASIKPAPIKPLSESVEPLKSISDVPTQDSVTNKDADPLQSQEVNEGLNQLLAAWMLFNKSGLFGTGPKGSLHPLYQKIKDLQIPLLLAGRFEGATQEIKQSITDYMNGWRYEQGIIYEQGETFDHYLRRVIRHILDLQK